MQVTVCATWLRIFSYYFLKRYSTLKISGALYKIAW